jgi:hypothetical protein
LKVIEKEQLEESRLQRKKEQTKKEEVEVMKSNIKQIENKKVILGLCRILIG